MDTPDVIYNPVTKRFEAATSHRRGKGDGPKGKMKVNLYSMAPEALFAGNTNWQYEGTLIRYKDLMGIGCDGLNPVGSVIDSKTNTQYIYVWGGDGNDKSGIFQYTRSLDTKAVCNYLTEFYGNSVR